MIEARRRARWLTTSRTGVSERLGDEPIRQLILSQGLLASEQLAKKALELVSFSQEDDIVVVAIKR